MSKKRMVLNYSRRHAGQSIDPQNRCRTYVPSSPTYMADGVPVTSYRAEPKPENRRHGFAYESTRRVHVD